MKTIEANTPVTRFLLILKMGDQHHQLMTTIYTKGACYALCALLGSVFAGAQYFFVHDDEIGNHWITLIDDVYYDIRGALELSEAEKQSLIPFNQLGLDNMLIYAGQAMPRLPPTDHNLTRLGRCEVFLSLGTKTATISKPRTHHPMYT